VYSEKEEKDFKKRCRECHYEVIEKWDESEVVHYPYVQEKCEVCHAAKHKKLTSRRNKPCEVCHNLALNNIRSAHATVDVSGSDCTFCHYAHGASKPGMLKETIHPPFGAKMCQVCHDIDVKGGIKPKEDMTSICLMCHDDKKINPGDVVHPAFEMLDCIECHSPHTTTRDKLLLDDLENMSEFCLSCHDGEAPQHPHGIKPSDKIHLNDEKKWLSYEGKVTCISCHNPHKSKNPSLLRESPEDGGFCSNCHIQEDPS